MLLRTLTPLLLSDYPTTVLGDGYLQWAYVDNGVLRTSKGLQVRVRQ